MSYRQKLTDLAETAIEDVRYQLEYDEVTDKETGEVRKVSKIGEGTRKGYNLALMALHPDAPRREEGARMMFVLSGEAADVFNASLREMTGNVLGMTIDAKALPIPEGEGGSQPE